LAATAATGSIGLVTRSGRHATCSATTDNQNIKGVAAIVFGDCESSTRKECVNYVVAMLGDCSTCCMDWT
jgi:hypothetical protein